MTINKQKLGAAIRDFRRLRNLTQAELAAKVGLAANSIAILERGERNITVRNLNAIAKALAVPASCLTIMGTERPGHKNPSADRLIESLQRLIVTTTKMQTHSTTRSRTRQTVTK